MESKQVGASSSRALVMRGRGGGGGRRVAVMAMPRGRKSGAGTRRKGGGRASRGPISRVASSLDDAYSLATKAYSMARTVASFMNVEEKLFDVSTIGQAINTTATVLYLSDVNQGVAFNNRTGNSIKCIKFIQRWRLKINTSASTSFVRCLVVQGRQRETANPVLGDVLESAGTAAAAMVSPYEHSFEDRWKIVVDKVVNLTLGGQAGLAWESVTDSLGHIMYQNGTGAVGNAAEGQLFALIISDEATNTPTLDIYTRLVFVDN